MELRLDLLYNMHNDMFFTYAFGGFQKQKKSLDDDYFHQLEQTSARLLPCCMCFCRLRMLTGQKHSEHLRIQRATAGAVLRGGHHINVLDHLEGKK